MKSFIAAALALVTLAASAREFEDREPRGYVSAYAGQAKWDVGSVRFDEVTLSVLDDNGLTPLSIASSLDDGPTAFGAAVGYLFSPYVGIEAGYVTLGTAKYRALVNVDPGAPFARTTADVRQEISAKGITLGLSAFVPIGDRFDVHARGGLFLAQTKFAAAIGIAGDTPDLEHETNHSRDGWYGYGVAVRLVDDLQLTVDYTHFRNVGDRSETIERTVSFLNAGLVYRF